MLGGGGQGYFHGFPGHRVRCLRVHCSVQHVHPLPDDGHQLQLVFGEGARLVGHHGGDRTEGFPARSRRSNAPRRASWRPATARSTVIKMDSFSGTVPKAMVSPARSMSRQGCPANTPTTGTSTLAAKAKIRTVRASSARGAHRTQRGDGASGPQRGAGFHHRHHDDHRTDRERIGELTEYCREDRDGGEQQLQGFGEGLQQLLPPRIGLAGSDGVGAVVGPGVGSARPDPGPAGPEFNHAKTGCGSAACHARSATRVPPGSLMPADAAARSRAGGHAHAGLGAVRLGRVMAGRGSHPGQHPAR